MGADSQVSFGPMKLRQRTMSVLLVFAKEDAQSEAFITAARNAGHKCSIARSSDEALENFLDEHHNLVIIDHRNSKYFNAESLCRSIRGTKASDHTVIVAITKMHSTDKDEPSILPLLNAGFNRRFIENTNLGTCLNELLTIEHCEFRTRQQLKASEALFSALENVNEAIEITNEDFEIEYINPAYERTLGYSSDEILGKDIRELPQSERNSVDMQETINNQLKRGKQWEGTFYSRRKNGESFQHLCRIIPVLDQDGKICHHINVKYGRADLSLDRHHKEWDVNSFHSSRGSFPVRRESMARIHSMTIEAPMTQVINIINAAQENSPFVVAQALDKVLEILRSADIYSPLYNQVKEDQMTSDLVGGLMSTSPRRMSDPQLEELKLNQRRHTLCSLEPGVLDSGSLKAFLRTQGIRRRSSNHDIAHKLHTTHPHPHKDSLTELPEEIHQLLETEIQWDFDIISLERLSNKRPLVYLGMKIFNRFQVCEYLDISESILRNWFQLIEANYHNHNPYHNSTHAADVLHASSYFLDRDRVKNTFDQADEVAALIAAVVHDLDHPGRTNAFLVNSCSKLAILYNDLAVLESHHASLAFQLTSSDRKVDIFANLGRDEYRSVRQMIVDMVLATEMTKHFEHLSKFVNSINKVYCQNEDDIVSVSSERNTPDASGLSSAENRMLIRRMLIKCADVSNPTRPMPVCEEWASRISEEYFRQSEDEKAQGLPVMMPVFDRKTCSIPKSQLSFIDYFLKDLFGAWDDFCDVQELIQNLQNNYVLWSERREKEEREEKLTEEEET